MYAYNTDYQVSSRQQSFQQADLFSDDNLKTSSGSDSKKITIRSKISLSGKQRRKLSARKSLSIDCTNQKSSSSKLETSKSEKGLTEIVLSDNTQQSLSMVLPMLAHISHQNQDKWLTWIAPHGVSKETIKEYNFANHKVRLVHTSDQSNILKLFQDALSNGTSDTVVVNIDALSEDARMQLEQASNSGNTNGLILRAA